MVSRTNTRKIAAVWFTTALALLPGCRFGNRVESTTERSEMFSGYYETKPQELTVCANASSQKCAKVASNMIPPLISQVMSNPVAFILKDQETGRALFIAPDGNGVTLPVFLNAQDLKLEFLGNTSPQPLFRDPECTHRLYLEENGALVKDGGVLYPHPAGGNLKTSGRVAMTISVVVTIDGECETSLQEVASCFGDASKCGAASAAENSEIQAEFQDMFSPFFQARVMSESDIPLLRSFGYEVSYQ
jgi:hypothetical protein